MRMLIEKYLRGEVSESERVELLEWVRKDDNLQLFNELKGEWRDRYENSSVSKDNPKIWSVIQDRVNHTIYSKVEKTRKINKLMLYAAVLIMFLSVGSTAYISLNRVESPEVTTTVIADNGEISKVKLPDGSMVWINSGSELKFNNNFGIDNRDIELTGEAYFQVERNENIPMVVGGSKVHVKVLGTKFNVSSYPESKSVDVVLESGKVELLNAESSSTICVMQPGELATYNKRSNTLNLKEVNTARYLSWKDGIVNLYNQSLSDVVRALELRYNQEFNYSKDLEKYHFTLSIRDESLEDILSLIEDITPIKAVQKGDLITFVLDRSRATDYDIKR